MNIIEALDDPQLLGRALKNPATFLAWRALLKAVFGVSMSDDDAKVFRASTGLSDLPTAGFAILWLICGRRGGKSFVMALIAAYCAIFKDWRPFLSPGERAVVLVVAADREQAKVIRRYVSGILENPMFARHVESETADAIELKGNVVIEVATCSYRTVRGRSVCVALLDETAFWRSESTANPDKEVWRAIRGSMAQFGKESVSIIASSPYARKGLLYDGYKRHFGKTNTLNLVWKAGTKVMNPTISDEFLADEFEADPIAADAEFNANFRTDVESFVSQEVVDAAVDRGVFERPPLPGITYSAFCDPSGGASDAMTLAIGHMEGTNVLIDAIRERKPPFSPDDVVREFAALLKSYRIASVSGDRYAGQWPRERFVVHGVTYLPSEKPKSDLYRDFLPILNGGRAHLVDHPVCVAQIASLERRTARGGRDSVDHPPGGHDDVANAVAGVACNVIGTGRRAPTAYSSVYTMVRGNDPSSLRARMNAPDWWDEQGELHKAKAAREQARAFLGVLNPSPEQVETIAQMLIRENRVAGWDRRQPIQ